MAAQDFVFLYDLRNTPEAIKGATVENLLIRGPAIVYPVPGGNAFEGCTFNVPPGATIDAIIWEIPDDRGHFIGPIGIEDSTFRNCTFEGVGFVLSRSEADLFRKMGPGGAGSGL